MTKEFPPWFNPFLIKELRRMFHSKTLIVVMFTLLSTMALIFGVLLSQLPDRQPGNRMGLLSFGGFYWLLLLVAIVVLCCVLPVWRFALEERSDEAIFVDFCGLTFGKMILGIIGVSTLMMVFLTTLVMPFGMVLLLIGIVELTDMLAWLGWILVIGECILVWLLYVVSLRQKAGILMFLALLWFIFYFVPFGLLLSKAVKELRMDDFWFNSFIPWIIVLIFVWLPGITMALTSKSRL